MASRILRKASSLSKTTFAGGVGRGTQGIRGATQGKHNVSSGICSVTKKRRCMVIRVGDFPSIEVITTPPVDVTGFKKSASG